jgi:sugar/nucleoside kinase (ribokinase family)
MFDVICLGILVSDVVAKTVNQIPEKGKLLPIEQISLHTGGCAVNTAIDLAKIGFKSAIIGKVGKDGFGEHLKNQLDLHKVNIDGLVMKEGINTSASVVLSSHDGERTFLHCFGANADFIYNDVNFDIIKNSRILYIAGTNLMPKFDGIPCSQVLKQAKELGIYTAMDTAWDASGRWMEIVEPSLHHLDLFMPSYDEAKMITGKDDPEAIADTLLSKGVKLAVVKLGIDGCYIKNYDGEKHLIPTYSHIKAIDTTGAGDAFSAGFLAGLIMKWDLYKCGKFANAVGTHCVMEIGASTGIRSMKEILEFMQVYQ